MNTSQEKIHFSESKLYPILFMIIITMICVGILATIYNLTKSRIELYQESQLQKEILKLFELPYEPVDAKYENFITEISNKELPYYIAERNGETLGYCFRLEGSGLWGTIRALVALDPSLKRIIGFRIIEQNETPGLGARITEEWFLEQFKDKLFLLDEKVVKFTLIPEDENAQAFEINQITGATSSSNAVVGLLYFNLVKILQDFQEK